MNDLVSVIILTWNRAALLKETVDSVLRQTYQNLEVLIIDNESTDRTQDYVAGLSDRRVKYFKNQNNGILSVNRNFGIRRARGDYVAFCDDDDLWLPIKLEKQMAFLRQHPGYKIICTNGVYFDDKGDIGCLLKNKVGRELTRCDFLKGKNYVVLPSVVLSKEVFATIGSYNEDPRIVNTEDYEFMVRATGKYPIYLMSECLVKYRIHDVMTSHANTLITKKKELLFFRDLHEKKILDTSEYRTARNNLRRKYVIAFFKELLKKSKIVKSSIYLIRRARLKLQTKLGNQPAGL